MRKNVWCALALAFLAALPALAQGLPTGTLTGRVTDGDGAVLPGVTVTASSPALQGTRSATTGESGDYNIPLLPPGDYTVTFEMDGFATAQRTVRMAAAQTTSLNHELSVEQVSEVITVTGSFETISTQPQAATTLTKQEVEALPVNRNIREAVLLTAGVSETGPGGNITISGGQSYENLFLVNGVVVNENLRGQPFDLFIEDAIEETTTTTSAVSAEYGRFAGGVVNTITKSGGNQFSASVRVNFDNDDWLGSNRLSPERPDELNETYEATLGGFLWRDKAWFFLAGRDRETAGSASTTLTGITYPTGREQTRTEGKLTLSPWQGHRLVGTYLEIDDLEIGNIFPPVLDTKSQNNRETPQELRALNYTGVLTENFFVEAQYSEREFTFIGSGSRFTDRINGTLLVDTTRGRYHSPTFCGVCEPEGRNNENTLFKASYFLSTERLGGHELIGGYDTFTDIRKADNHQSGSDFRILFPQTVIQGTNLFPVFRGDGTTIIQYNPIVLSSKGTDFVTNSFFLNDRWRLNDRWSFNLGLRYDENDGRDAEGKVVASDSKVSPRLAATFDPTGDGDWIFNLNYAEYVTAIANNQADATSAAGNPATITFFYRGPDINTSGSLVPAEAALSQLFAWFDSVGGTNTSANPNTRSVFFPGGTSTIKGGSLASPSTIEYSAGVAKRLGSRGLVRSDYVHREGRDFYLGRTDLSTGKVRTPNGTLVDLQVIENNDSALERVYDGLHTQARFRFDRFDVGGLWTWSQTRGNVDGETGPNGPIRSGALSFPEYRDPKWNSPRGDLGTDARHRVRLWGTVTVLDREHHRLNASVLQNYRSGSPYGAAGSVDTRPFVTNPGYAIPPANVTYFFTGRDEFRTDDITSTDVAVNYAFVWNALGREVEIFLQPEVLNAFDEDGELVVNTAVFTNNNDRTLTAFNPFTTQPVEGVHWRRGPNFGKATSEAGIQQVRTFRFSVGVRF